MTASKVLVVDDSPTDLANIKGIVSDAGCLVLTASSGLDAIEKAKSEQPDVIFLDIIMPDMDGYEACRKLSKDADTKHIPIVFVTSKGQKADRVWAKMQGGKDLVAKPYTADEIVAQLNAF
jgi:twitching motility two-component system response regulator PilH